MNALPGKRLSAGRTAEVRTLGPDRVIKLFYSDEGGCCSEYESSITGSVVEFGGPAAQIFGTMQIGERYGIVMERIHGRNIFRILSKTPWEAKKMGRKLAQLHARIHSVHIPELRPQKDYLPLKIELSRDLLGQRCDRIFAHLETLPVMYQLCHGDLHPKNAMISPNRLVALDWADAYSGNYHGDVVKTYLQLILPYHSNLPRTLQRLTEIVQKRVAKAYLKEYMKISGCTFHDIQPWIVPLAAAELDGKTTAHQALLLQLIDENLESLEKYATKYPFDGKL